MDLHDYFKSKIIMDRKQFLKGLLGIGIITTVPKVITDILLKEREERGIIPSPPLYLKDIYVKDRLHLEDSCGVSQLQGYHGDIIIIDDPYPMHPMCRCYTQFDYWIDNILKKRNKTWNVV